ncbi:kinesin-like protein [Coemansia sp. RSA 2610]|nr:kinesin-like protein [Coemansia sp. RSA 2610]
MRSAPASKRSAPGNGSTSSLSGMTVGPGEKSPDIAGASAPAPDALVYTHEQMLELFRPQPIADDFIVNDCVFSDHSLSPVCMSELSAKEQEILSGPVNSIVSRRYNPAQHSAAHSHARNGLSQRSNGHASLSGPRARPRDGDRSASFHAFELAAGSEYPYAANLAPDGLDADRNADSLWADQSIVRDNVGSFGADGVFRMGSSADDADLLERPSPRNSSRGDALRGPSAYSSRTASPAVATSRATASKSPPDHPSGAAADGWAWNDLAGPPSSAAQQRVLAERAERIKWCYRDPQGNTQGPFSTAHMQEWCSAGYFPAELQVCHEGAADFVPLSTLIARAGQSQDVFLYSAMVFLAQNLPQSSGLGTPTTPAALSRVGSSAHLMPMTSDMLASSSGLALPLQSQPAQHGASGGPWATAATAAAASGLAAVGAANSEAGTVLPTTDALGAALAGAAPPVETSRPTSAAGGSLSQAEQLSALLKEQLLVVTAISERQHMLVSLQDRLQQTLAKLVRELTQESNSLHYKAQMERSPVQPELLYALQQQAQAAEERLRLEHAQLAQVHTAHIAQLETKIDPVIKDIMLRNGPGFALNFIGQRLQELSAQILDEPAPSSQPLDDASASQPATSEPASSSAALTAVDAEAAVSDAVPPVASTDSAPAPPASKPSEPEAEVDAAANKLDRLAVSDEKSTRKGNTKKASQKSKSAKKQAQANNVALNADKPAPQSDDTAKPAAALQPTPAPWSTPTSVKAKQPKKSLLQIQQEEEAATKKRRQAEEEQRQAAGISYRTGTSYADRAGGANRSLAAIMEEQYKESAGVGSSPASSYTATAGKPGSQRPTQPTQQPSSSASAPWNVKPATAPTASQPAAVKAQTGKAAAKGASDSALPSLEFLQWCYSRLGSLRGIDSCKFIEMLLTFPLQAPESTLEIISEQIYAYSTTLNGRAFAEDFAKRRRKDHNSIKGGSSKSAPVNWPQLMSSNKPAPVTGYASAVGTRPSASHSANGDTSFQVVGKKGRK